MKRPPRIRVIGSINLDIVARVHTLPRPGETVSGGVLAHYPGGKGANQALAARKLGADVAMFGCVGNDSAAGQALALLEANHVDLAGVAILGGVATGVALIAVDAKGENQIVVAPGFGIPLNTPWTKMPLNFHGNPSNMAASELMDHFSVQTDITQEPRQELEEFFRSLPAPTAPPAP
jgi:hypothetical protein